MFDAVIIVKYLLDRKVFYPEKSVGVGKISRDLGLSPSRVIRALRFLRMLGFVVRNMDSRRKKYSSWSLSRNIDKNLVGSLTDYVLGIVVDDKVSIYEWLDSFLDRYFFSGTVALLLNGLSWNDVLPRGILVIVDKSKATRVKKFYKFYRKTSLWERYPLDIVYVQSIDSCEYEIMKLVNSAVPVASVPQAFVDSLINNSNWGVDLLETLSILIGIMIPRILENDDVEYILRMVNLAKKLYGEKSEFLIAILKDILMRYYLYFEDASALRMYLSLREMSKDYVLSSTFVRKINEAFRATILGDRVAMHLGLEPDFMSQRSIRVPTEIFAVAEL